MRYMAETHSVRTLRTQRVYFGSVANISRHAYVEMGSEPKDHSVPIHKHRIVLNINL